MCSGRVVQGGLWYGSRAEKTENHGSRNHENKQAT